MNDVSPDLLRLLGCREAGLPDLRPSAQVQSLVIASLSSARSPRLEGENAEHTRMLAEIQLPLPAIIVHREGLRVIDGVHRVSAAKLRGETTILAHLFDGTEDEAFLLAVQANTAHGLPLSHNDRMAAAAEIIQRHPTLSDRSVAAATGLSPGTIRSVRSRSSAAGQSGDTRVGRDGRVRPVDGRAGRERVLEVIQRSPNASLRAVAREAEVSPNTVRSVIRRARREDCKDANCGSPADGAAASRGDVMVALPEFSMESALRRLSQDPSVRLTESGRAAMRWFFSHVVRPREWASIVTGLPPHTAFTLSNVARQCAAEWQDLAHSLAELTEETG